MSNIPDLAASTDAVIEDAVSHADPMVLRGVLYQLTGDDDLANMAMARSKREDLTISDVESVADVDLLRAKAITYLRSRRDQGATDADLGPQERLLKSLSMTAGYELPEVERDLWIEQAAFDPMQRGVHWSSGIAPEARKDFLVAVVGSGLSGLAAAVQLKHAGIPFIVFEKNAEVGGTWYENRYPGARVDTASRGYSHQFGINYPFPLAFCARDEQLKYFKWIADEFGLREHTRFNTEVKAMAWDDAAQMWDIRAEGPDGARDVRVNAVISCVGFLSRPQLPTIAGMESFEGTACHSAQWPEGLSVDGKRAAVIGSGASGYQTLPVIAKTAEQTYLFQRTANWCFDDAEYLQPTPNQLLWLEKNIPFYLNFERLRLNALRHPDSVMSGCRADPDYVDDHARSAANKLVRDNRVEYINKQLASRPELIDKMIPPTPPLSSRPIRVDPNDNVYGALLRDNVALVSDPIERITPTGVRAGGKDYPVDILLYATGFKANDFLWPMEVRGREGARIEDLWAKDGPRAYLGAMLPGFPNLFMSYGPNSNNFGGFHVIDLLELAVQFAVRSVAGLIEQNKKSVEVTADGYWKFAEELDREEQHMLYIDKRAQNYYQNEFGRSAVNGPIDIRRMWRWMRDPAQVRDGPRVADAGISPYFGADLAVA